MCSFPLLWHGQPSRDNLWGGSAAPWGQREEEAMAKNAMLSFVYMSLKTHVTFNAAAVHLMELLSYAETLASLQDGGEDFTLAFPESFYLSSHRFWDSFDLGPAQCWR